MSQYTSYWLYQKYEKRGDQDWIPTYPNEYSVDANGTLTPVIKLDNDTACGYSPTGQTQYRWVDLNPNVDYYCEDCPVDPSVIIYRWAKAPVTDYDCVGVDKYYKEYYQYSTDGGATWQNVVPTSSRTSSDVIEYNSTDCGYVPPAPTGETIYRWVQTDETICVNDTSYENEYLTLVAKEDGIITFSTTETYYYSINGNSWTTGLTESTRIQVENGDKIRFKGTLTPKQPEYGYSRPGIGIFAGVPFDAEGNPMSLLFGDNFSGQTDLSGKPYAFYNLFAGCFRHDVNIDNLVLPATTLSDGCYSAMFWGCLFTVVPDTLLNNATTLTKRCYASMFADCINLIKAPILPAVNLADECYEDMFIGCNALTETPELPATILATKCYAGMFQNCYSLATIKGILPAEKLPKDCYWSMFRHCTSVSGITCLATEISEPGSYNSSTDYWLQGVSSIGTFTKKAGVTWPTGDSGIPSGWTVVER